MTEKLEKAARAAALAELPGWQYDAGRDGLMQSFTFANFRAAFAFMTQVALLAEKAGHHPDWSNSYDRVSILLRTHDAGGVSEKDVALARAIAAIPVRG